MRRGLFRVFFSMLILLSPSLLHAQSNLKNPQFGSFISGNCAGISLPCSVVYAGTVVKISGARAANIEEPQVADVIRAIAQAVHP